MNDLQVIKEQPLTVNEVKAMVVRVQEIMAHIMQPGIHYGKIPGCPKPSLFKPGAEKILSTFHIAADARPEDIIDLSTPDEVRYRVRVVATRQLDGAFLGSAIGECSSSEEKYKWRRPVCDEEFDDTDPTMRREKWTKGYQGAPAKKIKQVRTNPSDVANTILQMAYKRGLVPVTRVVTACSDVFEQDLEDIPAEIRESMLEEKREPDKADIKAPGSKSAKAASSEGVAPIPEDSERVEAVIDNVFKPAGDKKPWAIIADGKKFTFFADHIGKLAEENKGKKAVIGFVKKGNYFNLTGLEPFIDAEVTGDTKDEKKTDVPACPETPDKCEHSIFPADETTDIGCKKTGENCPNNPSGKLPL